MIMPDSDFVVLSFSRENTKYRRIDTEIAFKHGIRMCSSDTVGPGGIFRSLRELPIIIDMAKDVAELAPNAWLVNFVNPTTVLGMALRRYAPDVKSFALCDGNHEPRNTLMWYAGERVKGLCRSCWTDLKMEETGRIFVTLYSEKMGT
jgi:alpha-galactosidase